MAMISEKSKPSDHIETHQLHSYPPAAIIRVALKGVGGANTGDRVSNAFSIYEVSQVAKRGKAVIETVRIERRPRLLQPGLAAWSSIIDQSLIIIIITIWSIALHLAIQPVKLGQHQLPDEDRSTNMCCAFGRTS